MNSQWEVDQELADTLDAEFKKRKRNKQCRAKISDEAQLKRSWRYVKHDRRCRRAATVNGYCYQHAPLYAEHDRIVQRILEIPARTGR